MRFDLHLRRGIRDRLDTLATEMKAWEAVPRIDENQSARIRAAIQGFSHQTEAQPFLVGGVDGSGDYPAIGYADSFVYVTLAQGAVYAAAPRVGLQEVAPTPDPVVEFTWIPEEEQRRNAAWDASFQGLAGCPVEEVIRTSDYMLLKSDVTRSPHTVAALVEGLIRPHAADAGNIGIQLRTTAELGAALRMMKGSSTLSYLLIDGTLSLPLVTRKGLSLFYEHLKRLCCGEARQRGVGFFALSKSHGLPGIEAIEELARQTLGLDRGKLAEHWYLRLPMPGGDKLALTEGRRLPPVGALTYLVRFHRTTPVLRLDMDSEFWRNRVQGATEEETRFNEHRIFEALDYASHDQRCYGYPYPIKAGHDRASLTRAERSALRKQIVDAAVRAGMKRSLFRDAAIATGHE